MIASLRLSVLLALAVAAGGCSPGAAAADAPFDAGTEAAPVCMRPDLDAPWVRELVTRAVADLAKAPRATSSERERARSYLSTELGAMGWQPETHTYATGANVHATIPATTTTAGALVIVGAHFDSSPGSPGANDNASGVAVVLAVARALKDASCRTAPVSIAFFDEEELGLFGSRAFAKTFGEVDVRAAHTIDQVAWDADGDRRFEIELPTKELEEEWRAAAAIVGVDLIVTKTDGSDHQAFRELGIPAVGLTEEYVGRDSSPHRHTQVDVPASIDPYVDYLVLATKMTVEVVLAEVGESAQRDR